MLFIDDLASATKRMPESLSKNTSKHMPLTATKTETRLYAKTKLHSFKDLLLNLSNLRETLSRTLSLGTAKFGFEAEKCDLQKHLFRI